jgi:hypothetical protein
LCCKGDETVGGVEEVFGLSAKDGEGIVEPFFEGV